LRVVHKINRIKIRGEGEDNFLLTNGIGGFISFSQNNISKYQGATFSELFDSYKFVENIIVDGNIKEIINRLYEIERVRDNGILELFFMPKERNGFSYELNNTMEIIIDVDARKYYDFREWGRFYEIYSENNMIIIKYDKKTDKREDRSHGKKEYEIYLVILPDTLDYEKIERWERREYSYDAERKDIAERYIFRACKIRAKSLIFGFGTTKDKAIEEAVFIKENLPRLKKERKEAIEGLKAKLIINKEIKAAYLCCKNTLNELVAKIGNINGIFAGFYWFNQFWSRDELISLSFFLKNRNFDFVKSIIFRYLNTINEEGRIVNRIPPANGTNADGVGWLFKRVYDFIDVLLREGLLHKYISYEEMIFIKHSLEKSINKLTKYYEENGLILNKEKETWMDSIERKGARIEIQAMMLNMYKLLKRISLILKDEASELFASHKEKEMLNKVRESFWNGHYLNDGLHDKTIRPNIFLAYYIYPNLLSRREWIMCFDNVLPRLFVDFGLSTIDTHSLLFQPLHTGIDDKSYQNGDSWYYLNNIAAICLWRTGKFRYAKYINKILHGSTKDILWQGIIGHPSEISSARKQKAFGCLSQAWSAATYIELIDELF